MRPSSPYIVDSYTLKAESLYWLGTQKSGNHNSSFPGDTTACFQFGIEATSSVLNTYKKQQNRCLNFSRHRDTPS